MMMTTISAMTATRSPVNDAERRADFDNAPLLIVSKVCRDTSPSPGICVSLKTYSRSVSSRGRRGSGRARRVKRAVEQRNPFDGAYGDGGGDIRRRSDRPREFADLISPEFADSQSGDPTTRMTTTMMMIFYGERHQVLVRTPTD